MRKPRVTTVLLPEMCLEKFRFLRCDQCYGGGQKKVKGPAQHRPCYRESHSTLATASNDSAVPGYRASSCVASGPARASRRLDWSDRAARDIERADYDRATLTGARARVALRARHRRVADCPGRVRP